MSATSPDIRPTRFHSTFPRSERWDSRSALCWMRCVEESPDRLILARRVERLTRLSRGYSRRWSA